MEPSSDDWHVHTTSIISACLGRISSNYRFIGLYFTGDEWNLKIILEQEDPEDIEIANDIFDDYCIEVEQSALAWRTYGDAHFSDAVLSDMIFDFSISNGELKLQKQDQFRWIFLRKEESCEPGPL